VAGMGSPRELAEQRRGVIPRRMMARLCLRALNARTRAREQVRLRGNPRARRNPLEGSVSPRARRNPLEGGAWLGRSGGPRGPPQRGPRRVCVLKLEVCFVLFFAGFKLGSPGLLGDPQGCPRQDTTHMAPLRYAR
jgi:hypothetical protein